MVLCVENDVRRRGIGRALAQTALERLRIRGAHCAVVRTDLGSEHRSGALYEDLGFKRTLELEAWRRDLS